jgi:hypothetical protein
MRKDRRPRGFKSQVGVTKEKGHNNGKAIHLFRNTIYGIINDKEFRERSPKKWKKKLARRTKELYHRIESGVYRGEKEDFEVVALVGQMHCPSMVKMSLWAIRNLIETASTSELRLRAMQRHSLEEENVFKFGSRENQAEWRRIGNPSFMNTGRH